jgi:hypothetical protein
MNVQLRQLFDIVGESVDIDYSIGVDELREIVEDIADDTADESVDY